MPGGTFGVGTVAFALLMGPIVQFFLPRLHMDLILIALRRSMTPSLTSSVALVRNWESMFSHYGRL